MRIGLAHNLRTQDDEHSAELLTQEDVDRLLDAIRTVGHEAVAVEVTGTPDEIIDRLVEARPDLIFNVAEGITGINREAYYPAIFRTLHLPFTGSSSSVLHVGLDKSLTEAILARQGITVPRGVLITPQEQSLPEDMPFPLIIKPNAEGSSQGISQDSIVENADQARARIDRLLPEYPEGLTAEQYVTSRELAVPWLPGLAPTFSFMTAAKSKGIEFAGVIDLIITSAARRYQIPMAPQILIHSPIQAERKSTHDLGIQVGRFTPGPLNAITDVHGVRVGHVTHIRDVAIDQDRQTLSVIRTGITAILPTRHELFSNHLVCGGFILNGIGEMSGLTQAIEWGWLETPILLTNTMSIGAVHRGIIQFMLAAHPELGHDLSVVIPMIGETDDSFLNDVRVEVNEADDALEAIRQATEGPVEQGSVGGGTGMITFDFAGGIGSASRVLPRTMGQYTLGVLVQSNFGKMRNLTVEGKVVGKELDPLYPYHTRRDDDRSSVIVVMATDAPLLSTQLNQISKRAALGLGRVGSHASAASGEIIVAFSTANRTTRLAKEKTRHLSLSFVSDEFISPLYEAAVEATEEAVLNAMFCSAGMDGRLGRTAPAIPIETILDLVGMDPSSRGKTDQRGSE